MTAGSFLFHNMVNKVSLRTYVRKSISFMVAFTVDLYVFKRLEGIKLSVSFYTLAGYSD